MCLLSQMMYPLSTYLSEGMALRHARLLDHPAETEHCGQCQMIISSGERILEVVAREPALLTHVLYLSKQLCDDVNINDSRLLEWTKEPDLFSVALTYALLSEDSIVRFGGVILMLGLFERLLGNIIYAKGSGVPVPNMFSLVIRHRELPALIGSDICTFLDMLFGGPDTLNFRNLLWHGFLNPSDIDLKLGYCLFYVLKQMGKKHDRFEVRKRPVRFMTLPFGFDKLEFTYPNVDLTIPQICWLDSNFVIVLKRAFTVYLNREWLLYLCLCLPVLEHLLRSLYCKTLGLPERQLSSESGGLKFVDLDTVMFDNNYKLFQPVRSLLKDLFHHCYGPQIRNRISHGEIDMETCKDEMLSWPSHGITRIILFFLFELRGLEANLIGQDYISVFDENNVSQMFLSNALFAFDHWTNEAAIETFRLHRHRSYVESFIERQFLPNRMTALIQLTDLVMSAIIKCTQFDNGLRIKDSLKGDTITARKERNLQMYAQCRPAISTLIPTVLAWPDSGFALSKFKRVHKYVIAHKWIDAKCEIEKCIEQLSCPPRLFAKPNIPM